MNDLIVKDVPFCGTELLAVQQKDNGKIYVGINSILRELGFDERQIEYRRNKWNSDKVLYKGVQKFSYPSKDGGTQETYCIEIKRLPLALAKIDITPKMESDMSDLAEKLEKYQDECADVLAEAFLPKGHNIKQLTINSREVSKIIGKRHSWVLRGIRERIADLQEVGFDTSQMYIESTYVTQANNTASQYLCTEQGCEDFSRCLEPDKRKIFFQEFPDRFERMRNVLDGKPVKKLPKLICLADVEEKEPYARLYKTDSGGIVLMNDMVFNLASSEMEHLSRFVSELEKQDIEHIEYVVSSFLKSMKKSRKLEEIASWGVKA